MSVPAYAAYKDSGVEWLGKVPAHWEVKRLKRACEVFPSNVDKKSTDGQTAVRLCNYTDVYYSDVIRADMPFMEATASDGQIGQFTLRRGDTIFTKDSETSDDIARSAFVHEDLPGVVCGYHLSIARPLGATVGAFIKRFFDSAPARAYFQVKANGLTRVGLGQYAVDNVPIALPPPAEQAAIASFLDRETGKIDALVEEQRRLIALLKEKRQAVISHAVTKGLNPHAPTKDSGIEWLGDVPAHWELASIRHLCEILRGKFTHRPRNDPAFYDGDYPFIQTGDITGASRYITTYRQTLNERGASVSKKFPAGTLVMAIAANLGDVAILTYDAFFPDSIVGLIPKSGVRLGYLYYLIIALKPALLTNATVSTQLNINADQIAEIIGTWPRMEEQEAIAAYLDGQLARHDQLVEEAERGIGLLQERRAALISAAVTGKIDVRGLAAASVPQEAA